MAIQGKVVKEYLEKYPTSPTMTIAKVLHKENPELFDSPEAARSNVRYHRGKMGKKMRDHLRDKSHVGYKGKFYPFDLIPEGIQELGDYKPYHIQGEHILVIADTQIPYHDKQALGLALNHGREKKCDTVVILGDFNDHYKLSRFVKDPKQRDLDYEIDVTEYTLELIRETFPEAEIIWLKGNHEDRWEIYLYIKAPELVGVPRFSYEAVCNTDEYNIKVIADKRILKVGKHLSLLHGHEFMGGTGTPVNPARTLYLKAKTNALCAHFHRSSSNKVKTVDNKTISTWSIGCLCSLSPKFAPINEWNLGFARIRRDGDDFRVNNYMIMDNEIYRA